MFNLNTESTLSLSDLESFDSFQTRTRRYCKWAVDVLVDSEPEGQIASGTELNLAIMMIFKLYRIRVGPYELRVRLPVPVARAVIMIDALNFKFKFCDERRSESGWSCQWSYRF